MKAMSVRISEETLARLQWQAYRRGLPPAVLARQYLKESVENREDMPAEFRAVALPSTEKDTAQDT